MNKLRLFSLMGGISLAIAFIISCSSEGGGINQGGGDSSSGSDVSSNSDVGGDSSSSFGDAISSSDASGSSSSDADVSSSGGGSISSSDADVSSSDAGISSSGGGSISSSDADGGGKGNDIDNYRTVTIGGQTWMAENLDYAVEGSKCYDNNPANCDIYGRLYDWATAMGLPPSCNSNSCSSQIQSPHRGICPLGWHIPSYGEWNILIDYAGEFRTDDYGFSALLGGFGSSGITDSFHYVGDYGYWWNAGEFGSDGAYEHNIGSDSMGSGTNGKSNLFSVRCLQN